MKITNTLIHGLTGLFLWLFLVRALADSPVLRFSREQALTLASLTVALWLLHPLHASTVLYTVQRMTQLAALFMFIGLWHCLRLRVQMLTRPPTLEDYSQLALVGLLWTLLASYSKENGLLLPFLYAVVELCLFRFRVAGGYSALLRWGILGALGGLVLFQLVFPLLRPDVIAEWYSVRDFTLSDRMLTQPRVLWQYLGWLIVPDISSMGLHHDDVQLSTSLLHPLSTLLSILGFVVLGGLSWWLRDRWPLLVFAVLWFLIGHATESTIIPLELVYEHRNYLPAVGPLLLISTLVLVPRPEYKGYARFALGLFLLAFPILLFLRTAPWTSNLEYAESAYRNNTTSVRALRDVAGAYFNAAETGEHPELTQQYFAASRLATLKALELDPGDMATLSWLVYLDSNSTDTSRISEWYDGLWKAMDKPVLSRTEVSFLDLLAECVAVGQCQETPENFEEFMTRLTTLHPDHGQLHISRAYYCKEQGRYDCVLDAADQLLKLDKFNLNAYRLDYGVYFARGDEVAAMGSLREILREDRQRRYFRTFVAQYRRELPAQ